MNRAFFNKAKQYSNAENDEAFDKLETTFEHECEKIRRELMINNKPKNKYYDLAEFLVMYDNYVRTNKYTTKQALEKFVLNTVYSSSNPYLKRKSNMMNAKFKTKHFGTAANKLAKLKQIKNFLTNPRRNFENFSYGKLNDPDYYDLYIVSNHTFTKSVNLFGCY